MASERQIVRTRLAEAQEAVRAPEEFLHEGLARAQGAIDAAAMRHRRATQTALREFPTILANGRPELYDAWGSSRFSVWSEHPALPGEVRVGEVPLGAAALVPATVPLFAGRTVVVVTSTEPAARTARAMIRALAVRASLALGHLGTLHLLDPAQEGFGFTERALLRNTAPLDATPSTSLGAVIDAAYRRRETPDGRVDLVLALDFPLRFDFGAVESLNRIARLSAAGVQLIVHHDLAVEAGNAGHGRHLDLTNPVVIEVRDDGTAHHAWGSLNVTLDSAPPTELVERLTARLPQLPDPQMGTVRFADLNPIEPAEWWRHTATELVSVPVGAGPGGTVSVMFGQEPGGVAHTHAVVGGQPGSGKSELLHTIITGIVTRYGPDDVQLYLVDGQSGVSFQRYRNLPHAVLVSLSTPIDLARGVLLDLDSEFQRRESLLIGSGAQSLTEYRGLGGRGMPRLIVVIDEYQRLFHGDRRDETAGILQRVAAQGRKVGIHLLLASQRFHATGLLNQDALFNNISTRIGMMLPPDALGSVDEFAKEGRGLLGNCTHPGDIVVNHHGGADGHNEVGRVAWLGEGPPRAILDALAAASPHRPELIDGKASPQVGASLALRTLALTPPTPQAIREWAESGPRDGGLGVNSWQPYDQPWPFILGRTFTAHGSAAAKVDRAAEHNIALLHADAAVLHGMLATGLTAAGLAIPPGGLEVWTLHQLAGPGEPWATALTTDLAATLPGHRVRHSGEAVTLLDEATSELQRRESLTVAAQADIGPLIVVATGLDRVAAFRTVEGRYGEEPSRSTQALLELARRGPFVGVHVLLGFASVPQWSQVMPPKAARHFVHRVVSQLSEDHSRVIVDGSFATRVMPAGTVGPARCGYHNRDTQEAMVFLPYRYDEEARSQLASIAGRRNHGLR